MYEEPDIAFNLYVPAKQLAIVKKNLVINRVLLLIIPILTRTF
jgi:hypothetical protein